MLLNVATGRDLSEDDADNDNEDRPKVGKLHVLLKSVFLSKFDPRFSYRALLKTGKSDH